MSILPQEVYRDPTAAEEYYLRALSIDPHVRLCLRAVVSMLRADSCPVGRASACLAGVVHVLRADSCPVRRALACLAGVVHVLRADSCPVRRALACLAGVVHVLRADSCPVGRALACLAGVERLHKGGRGGACPGRLQATNVSYRRHGCLVPASGTGVFRLLNQGGALVWGCSTILCREPTCNIVGAAACNNVLCTSVQ